MISLSSDSDILRMTTDAAVDKLGVYASWVDYPLTGDNVYGATVSQVSSVGTFDILETSGTRGVERQVLGCFIANTSGDPCGIILKEFNGSSEARIADFTLNGGETLVWTVNQGFFVHTSTGTKLG